MATWLLKRLAQALVIVALTTTATFFLIHAAPGEPFAALLEDPRTTDAMRAAQRARYGLDLPLLQQYGRFVGSIVRGDLGESFTYRRPVVDVIGDTLPRTLLLMATALVTGFGAGIVLGTWQGAHRGSATDRVTGGIAILVASLPDFWIALVALLLFAFVWHVLPVSGVSDPTLGPGSPLLVRLMDRLRHLVLPAGTLALVVAAGVSRYQRASLLEVLPDEYLRTARAKGVPRRRVLFGHALRNALLPTITLAGLLVPTLLGGAVFVEVTFAWQGMGSLAVQAVGDRDYPLILAIVLLSSALVVVGAMLADLAHAAADPRQRRA